MLPRGDGIEERIQRRNLAIAHDDYVQASVFGCLAARGGTPGHAAGGILDSLRLAERGVRFVLGVPLIAYVLHWTWEMLQMPTSIQMAGRSWRETASRCALAAVGDAVITLLIYMAGALVASSFTYGM